MANQFINLYMNNPTANGTDGTAISLDGSQTAPLSFTLDAASSEAKTAKCAVRCGSGYKTSGDTTISFEGENAEKWSVSDSEEGPYSSSLVISDEITAVNRLFYVKAQAAANELPQRDESVSIILSATVVDAGV